MAIDVETRRPRLANVVGGLSGPAIRPIAVRLVYQTAQAVKIPVIGIGGIGSAEDALEFLIAGARAVQIGTMNFVDPSVWSRTLEGLADYCRRHALSSITEVTGTLRVEGGLPSGW
jgi:dihydroorotate dehydrogenase (NAD+) catalytic subunit